MKNSLQYVYSIGVFLGVLFSAYLMMNRDGSSRVAIRSFEGSAYRSEATMVDPAVSQLLEMDNALSKLRKDQSDQKDQKDQAYHRRGASREAAAKTSE